MMDCLESQFDQKSMALRISRLLKKPWRFRRRRDSLIGGIAPGEAMRGFDERGGVVLVCRSGEAGSRRSSASGDPIADQRSFVGAVAGFCGALFRSWAAIDRARDAAASDAVAGVLLGALGTPADGSAPC